METDISTDLTPAAEELIQSFKNLVINCSGDLETLGSFEKILNNEIERLSLSGSEYEFVPLALGALKDISPDDIEITPTLKSDPPTVVRSNASDLPNLVDYKSDYLSFDIMQNIKPDLENLFKKNN